MMNSFVQVCYVFSETISEVKHGPIEARLDDVLHTPSLLSVVVNECHSELKQVSCQSVSSGDNCADYFGFI